MSSRDDQPVFRELAADDPDPEVTEIESLCINCRANGMTRILLTRIPYYKNVVIMSFSCEECGYANNEIQPGGAYAEMGVRWTLNVKESVDMNRQIVKSDHARVYIPELEFEIPSMSQKGEVTTVEGVISRAIDGLCQDQESRLKDHPEDARKIAAVVEALRRLRSVDTPWTFQLEDISGNCFVENPHAPSKDPRCERDDFARTAEQNHALGIFTHEEVSGLSERREPTQSDSLLTGAEPGDGSYEQLAAQEVLQFRTNCPDCNAPAETNMKMTNIPYFKEVVIMATVCDACGHRTNEVKSGGGIEDKGVRFEVRVAGKEDFSRDILKSETCSMEIPELQLEVGGRALGGRFSTAEGLLRATADQLADSPGALGDAPGLNPRGLQGFVNKLNMALEGEMAVTIILDDPAGNSYVQSLAGDPTAPDPGLKVTRYERTYEQNEELGLNDMKTENYDANR